MSPLVYDPSFEVPEEDEAATGQALIDTMRKISETTFHDLGLRSAACMRRATGCCRANWSWAEGLPEPPRAGSVRETGPSSDRDALLDHPRRRARRQGLHAARARAEGARRGRRAIAGFRDRDHAGLPVRQRSRFGAPTAKAFLQEPQARGRDHRQGARPEGRRLRGVPVRGEGDRGSRREELDPADARRPSGDPRAGRDLLHAGAHAPWTLPSRSCRSRPHRPTSRR